MNMVELTERLAVEAHPEQVDRAGQAYIDHPRRVAAKVAETSGPDTAVPVAWLHDVVEDTAVTLQGLRQLAFGEDVVNAVDALTRRPGEGDQY